MNNLLLNSLLKVNIKSFIDVSTTSSGMFMSKLFAFLRLSISAAIRTRTALRGNSLGNSAIITAKNNKTQAIAIHPANQAPAI
jgi:hypothetical protein